MAAASEPTAAAAPEPEPDDGNAWTRVRREADDIARERGYTDAPAHFRTILWIDRQCVRAGMHALDDWWLGTLLSFYASGKLVLVCRVGLRGAKSVTICRALVNDALFGRCEIDPGTVAVIPIMSADRTEATDRFHTIKAILAACGVRSDKGDDEGAIVVGGLAAEYKARTLPSGGGVIEVTDCEGRAVEFRIYPARLTGVIGHTDKAGFGDELDTWPVDLGVSAADVAQRSVGGKANPADVVLDRWLERFTTTRRTAHLYLVSASYFGEDTAHARKVREGDTSIQMVARLGAMGAERDNAARARLAYALGSSDPRLLDAADPHSTNVPAWVSNPPKAAIEDCYALSRDRLGPMFGRYGGRPDEAEGARGPLAGIEFPVDECVRDGRSTVAPDAVMGLAPMGGGWGRVLVALLGFGPASGSFVVLADYSGAEPMANIIGASVLACATDQARAVEAERLAWLSGRPAAYLPPVAPQAIYDGNVLRLAPLRTLYERGRLRHAPGLSTLEAALRGHRDDSDRNPRLEALLAAVMRLVACYPWLGVAEDERPWTGPGAVDAFHERGPSAGDTLRRLGAR